MIYLASPFFYEEEQEIYNKVISHLRSQGEEVFVPQEHKVENEWDISNEDWGNLVFGMDYQALVKCDEVIVLYWGMYSDTGTAWECGAAFAMGKKITIVLCDIKSLQSLMVINGCNNVVTLQAFLNDAPCIDKCTKIIKNLITQK